jgi:hypothetical protein
MPAAYTLQEIFLGGSYGLSVVGSVMSMRSPNQATGNRTRDLSACSKVIPVSRVQSLNVGWLRVSHHGCEKNFLLSDKCGLNEGQCHCADVSQFYGYQQ